MHQNMTIRLLYAVILIFAATLAFTGKYGSGVFIFFCKLVPAAAKNNPVTMVPKASTGER